MHFLLRPLMRLLAWLVSRGCKPRLDRNADGPVLIYPLRGGARPFCLGALLLTCWLLADGVAGFRKGGLALLHAGNSPSPSS